MVIKIDYYLKKEVIELVYHNNNKIHKDAQLNKKTKQNMILIGAKNAILIQQAFDCIDL
jgi:hypothetical protein